MSAPAFRYSHYPMNEAPPSALATLALPQDPLSLHHAIQEGFAPQLVKRFADISGIEQSLLLAAANISKRTFDRRKAEGKALSTEASNGLARVLLIFERALALFEGNITATSAWLCSEVKGLGGQTPLALAATEAGGQEVLRLIGRLQHGVFA